MISNLEYYRTFFAVGSFLSFTKAADYLCVSQPAVSQSIRRLEEELGCTLFFRSGRSLFFTAEGQELFRHVKVVMKELHSAEYYVSRLSAMKTGELIIGATETCIRFYLMDKIRHFRASHPDIRLIFRGATTHDLCRLIENSEMDIGLVISPLPEGYSFSTIHVRDFQDVPVVSKKLGLDPDRVYSPEDLTAWPLIAVSEENIVRQLLEKWFFESHSLLNPAYTVRNMSMVAQFIREDLGIGILPRDYVAADLASGALMELKMNSLPEVRSLYITTNPNVPFSEAGRQFMELLKADAR